MKRLRGVHAPHLKNTAGFKPVVMPIPKQVRIPMSMHIGAPAKPVVAVGDEVRVGQLIGEAGGFVSAPVHASVSGKVKSINDYDEVSGQKTVSITIDCDGEQTPFEGLSPPQVETLDDFLDAVKNCGSVGLGGAGFPTAVKLTVKNPEKLEFILINGAECEPFITSDTRTMIDDAELVWDGIELLRRFYKVKKIIIGIEKNKPEPIKKMLELSAGAAEVEVSQLPALYPQGGEKVLIFNTTGRIVPEGGLPLDVGVIVLNCTTVAAIARYIKTGMPLVSKCVTVDGSAVKEPKNVIVPIGTPIREVFEFCGGLSDKVNKVLLGGPMMGIAQPSLDAPVQKSTNAVLAFADSTVPEETACIRCGQCVSHCPLSLMPLELERAYSLNKPEMLERYKVNLCMECGCCAFSCPAKRPLVQVMKLSKIMLRDYQASKKTEDKPAKKEKGAKKG